MSDLERSCRCAICNGCLKESGYITCTSCRLENAPRVDAVTSIFQKVDFHCRFAGYGCKENIGFGEIAEHEDVCQFKPVFCFISPTEKCSWSGYSKDLMKHFSEKHRHSVFEACEVKIDFKTKIDKKVAVFYKNGVLTIVCYEFKLDRLEFVYSICYLSQHNYQISYEIEVANVNNKNCRFLVKCDKNYVYQANWFNSKSVLNLKNLLPPLKKDDLVFITLRSNVAINYDELLKLKCKVCCTYVTLPIFKLDDGPVCRVCAEKHNLKQVEDKYLESKITELSYPCKWQHCTTLVKYNEIREHEKTCNYRRVVCPDWSCCKTFKIEEAHRHFATHSDYRHITEKQVIYWYHSLQQYPSEDRYFYVVQKDDVFAIKYEISSSEFWFEIMPAAKANCITTFLRSHCCNRVEELAPNVKIDIPAVFKCCSIYREFPLDGKISFNIIVKKI